MSSDLPQHSSSSSSSSASRAAHIALLALAAAQFAVLIGFVLTHRQPPHYDEP
jgi:hypothetical protein